MTDILLEVSIEGSPEDVYQAITEGQGIAEWWSTKADARPEKDSVVTIGFGPMFNVTFTVDKLEADREVVWLVNEPTMPDWADTRITWEINADDNGNSVLLLGHRDFKSTDGSFASTNYNWAYYLTSLKQYVETGTGMPYVVEG